MIYLIDPEYKVVFRGTPKCASTSYNKYFLSIGWLPIKKKDILPTHQIFTYIRDPKDRIRSAIIQDIFMIIQDFKIINLKQAMMLLEHNYLNILHNPILIVYHAEYLSQLIMLPLDYYTEEITNMFFKHCGINSRIIKSEIPNKNITENNKIKKELFNMYKHVINNYKFDTSLDDLIFNYLINNIVKYNESESNDWPSIFNEDQWFKFLKQFDYLNYNLK